MACDAHIYCTPGQFEANLVKSRKSFTEARTKVSATKGSWKNFYCAPFEIQLKLAMALIITDKALQLILEAEGLDQPAKWPGGGSGITLGIGYDLGFVTVQQFEQDWGTILSADQMERLKTVIGLTGGAAKMRAPQFGDIKVTRAQGEEVFLRSAPFLCTAGVPASVPRS